MSPSARFAETDFPAEVEDLITALPAFETPSCAAVAGYAVIAAPSSTRALLFAIAAGSGLDAVPVPLQPSSAEHTPSLVAWRADHDGPSVRAIAVAALTSDGALRVFPAVDVRATSQTHPRCAQVRVATALAASARVDATIPATKIARDKDGVLFVFGGRGTAAKVLQNRNTLEVFPLHRAKEEASAGSLRFGSVFYSAIRSIGAGVGGRDVDWEAGEGVHEIVGCGATTSVPGVVVVRSGGVVERWAADGLRWTFSVFDYVGGRSASRCVVSAHVTSDDTAVVLVKSDAQADLGHRIVCFDVRSSEALPKRTELDVPLDDGAAGVDSQCLMVVSGDIAYFYMEVNRTLAWLSVARGVSAEGQVQGNTPVGEMNVLTVVDAAFGLEEATVPGGIAAFIHPAGVWLASSAVPPPMSFDQEEGSSEVTSITDAANILWRAFLQYCADQKGATKASLRGLINSLVAEGGNLNDVLSSTVEQVSRKIIVSDQDPEQAPVALLVDTELEKKHAQHSLFSRMLTDAEIFCELRPDAPSLTEDRIWTAIKVASRYAVVTDGEKIASARRIRDLENRQSSSGYYQRFNDAASNSLMGSGKIRSAIASAPASASRRGTNDPDTTEIDIPSVLSSALILGGADISGGKFGKKREDSASELYRNPHEFHRFLPALERSMSEALAKLQSDYNLADDNGASEAPAFCRAAQNIVLLSCEAAIDVVQGSREARETTLDLLSVLRQGMSGVGNWMSDVRTCGNMLMKISQQALEIGAKSRQAEGRQMMHAATLVVDELLSRTPFDDTVRNARRVGRVVRNPQAAQPKRRRLDLVFEGTERGKELRSALDMLRQSGLEEEAFRLAEKYGDYGTMLALRVGSPDFDAFMETSLRKFGDEFGLFAFSWLEDRGEIRLLLRGQNSDTDGTSLGPPRRSDRMNSLLSDYFRTERRHLSNLAWIHWVSQGNILSAADALIAQTKKLALPGKTGSAINTPILSSIAKLAMLADNSQQNQSAEKHEGDRKYLTGKLNLSKLQARLDPNADAFLETDDLIHQFMEIPCQDSDSLAEQVVMAVEALRYSGMDVMEAQALEDFVWQRCVEKESNVWLPIVGKMSSASDIEMRQKLKDTALFMAAIRLSMDVGMMSQIIERGAFEVGEFEKQGCTREVASLVNAAVSLAAS